MSGPAAERARHVGQRAEEGDEERTGVRPPRLLDDETGTGLSTAESRPSASGDRRPFATRTPPVRSSSRSRWSSSVAGVQHRRGRTAAVPKWAGTMPRMSRLGRQQRVHDRELVVGFVLHVGVDDHAAAARVGDDHAGQLSVDGPWRPRRGRADRPSRTTSIGTTETTAPAVVTARISRTDPAASVRHAPPGDRDVRARRQVVRATLRRPGGRRPRAPAARTMGTTADTDLADPEERQHQGIQQDERREDRRRDTCTNQCRRMRRRSARHTARAPSRARRRARASRSACDAGRQRGEPRHERQGQREHEDADVEHVREGAERVRVRVQRRTLATGGRRCGAVIPSAPTSRRRRRGSAGRWRRR